MDIHMVREEVMRPKPRNRRNLLIITNPSTNL